MANIRFFGASMAGQSNFQGAACDANGGTAAIGTSRFTGNTDPYDLNYNGAGSMLPAFEDACAARGVRYKIHNGAIGGASVLHFTGVKGATVVNGLASTPAANVNMVGVGLTTGTGGTNTPCVEGDAGFDPFGFLARIAARKAPWTQMPWVFLWQNGESDSGLPSATYQAALVSLGNWAFNHGYVLFAPGLSACGNNSKSSMETLNAGVDGAVAQLRAQGKNVIKGCSLYDLFGMEAALYPERTDPQTKVHLTLPAQVKNGQRWSEILANAGY